MKKIDLHLHSNLSDGEFDIGKLIKYAKDNNIEMMAITDHDYIDNYERFSDEKIEVLSGIELNTNINGMHILGYGINDIDKIKDVMQLYTIRNEIIVYEVIKLLNKHGYIVSASDVLEYANMIEINSKYLNKKKLVKYLIYKGYANDVLDAYDRIIGRNTDNYIPIYKLDKIGAINLINECGGFAVLAHPNTIVLNENTLYNEVKSLVDNGLKGIETYSSKINHSNHIRYSEIANYFGLVETAGSDFHSIDKQNMGVLVDDEYYNKFLKILKK